MNIFEDLNDLSYEDLKKEISRFFIIWHDILFKKEKEAEDGRP